jgi:hypothetical protein
VEWLAALLQERYLPPAPGLNLPESMAALEELILLSRRGAETAARLILRTSDSPRLTLAGALSTFAAVDQGLRRLAAGHPELAAPVAFFFQDQRLAVAQEVPALARELSRAYRRLGRLAELCREAATQLAPAGSSRSLGLAQGMQALSATAVRQSPEAR